MPDPEDRSFSPSTVSSNRAQQQGLGVGQEELNLQQAPNRDEYATDPGRTEPFDQSLERTTNADRPSQADFSGQEPGDVGGDGGDERGGEARGAMSGPDQERDLAGYEAGGDLGVGTPAGVDVHDLGQRDKPEEDWGQEAEEDAMFSSNHTRRPVRTEAERGQGAKTRQLNKDIVSRRS